MKFNPEILLTLKARPEIQEIKQIMNLIFFKIGILFQWGYILFNHLPSNKTKVKSTVSLPQRIPSVHAKLWHHYLTSSSGVGTRRRGHNFQLLRRDKTKGRHFQSVFTTKVLLVLLEPNVYLRDELGPRKSVLISSQPPYILIPK